MTNEQLRDIKMAWARGEVVQNKVNGEWVDWVYPEYFHYGDYEWRIKPKTIRIGTYDVPEPERSVGHLRLAYLVDISRSDYCTEVLVTVPHTWGGILERGIVHSTREAAELHAKALLSFTEQK